MSRIEVREERKDRYWALRIDPTFDPENAKRGFQPKVTAYCEQDYSFEDHDYHWKRAEVSWYSIGSVSSDIGEAYSKAIAIATEHARKMDAEHKLPTAISKPKPVVTIVLCPWCTSLRPIEVQGIDRAKIPPGAHEVLMQLSDGICDPCGVKFNQQMIESKAGVTHNDTVNGQSKSEGSKGA